MSNWLEDLRCELVRMEDQDILEPPAEVSSADHVVGKITDEMLKRMFALSRHYERRAAQMELEARFAESEAGLREMSLKIRPVAERAAIIKDIFWAALKDQYLLWDKVEIGVRRGWQVVWSEPQDQVGQMLARFLKGEGGRIPGQYL